MRTWEEAIIEEVSFTETAHGSEEWTAPDSTWFDENGRICATAQS